MSGPPSITTVRKKNPPKGFQPGAVTGREARWATWAFIFGGYFADRASHGEQFLEWCAAAPMEITEISLRSSDIPPESRDDAERLSKLLYKELRALCTEGEPLAIVKNLVTGNRGAEVWRRFTQRYQLRGRARQTAIEEDLFGIKWPTDEDAIPGLIDDMEAMEPTGEVVSSK